MTPLLTYFDIRGKAEVIRLILEEVGAPYRERRVSIAEWPALKPSLPFGQMPTFQDGELLIVHSHAIYRHLARKHGLYGANESERTRCDIVEESFVDADKQLIGWFWDPAFAEKRSKWERDILPESLTRLQQLLSQNQSGQGFWVGNDLTYVDLIAWHFLDCVRAFSRSALESFPLLNAFKQRIESRPRIREYLESERRPATVTVPIASYGGTPETS